MPEVQEKFQSDLADLPTPKNKILRKLGSALMANAL